MVIEEILHPGESTAGVVKIGNTVRRTQNTNSEFVHRLLLLLEEESYPYSPRYLGIDDQGREILSFVEGPIAREVEFTEDLLNQAILMIKQFHDATCGSELAGKEEVVCHGDLAPWNFVLVKEKM